jgi:hypothetical protein
MALQYFHQYSKLTALQPTDIAGLALWIKGSTVLYDGSNYIYSAPDGSGNSNDASQGTAVNQPLRAVSAINGKDAIRYDGSSDFMTGTTIANLGTYCLDIFIVAKGASTTGSGWGMLFGVGNYTNGLWIGRHSGLQALAVYNNGTLIYTANNLPNAGFGYKIFELWKNSGVSAKILYNNILQSSKNLGNFTNANYYLGYGGLPYQQYFAGDEAEILIYVTPTALGDSDRALIGNYLQNEYALPFIVNKIPTMTSDTSPSGIVTYGHSIGGFLGWMAFDGDDTTYWNAGPNPSTYLCYELPVSAIFTGYYVKCFYTYSITDWTLQGYDGANWVILDTQTGQDCWSGNIYKISTPASYIKYKIVITAAQNNNPTIKTLMFS